MTTHDPNQGTPDAGAGPPGSAFLSRLRSVAGAAMILGAVGSLVLTLKAGRSTPRLLLILFLIWVASPFAALAWASLASNRWSVTMRTSLYGVTIAIALVSLVCYGGLVPPPPGSARAFKFLVVPLGSWVLASIVVSIAALASRKGATPGSGA